MNSNLTIVMTKLDVGYMAKIKEFPEIMMYSKTKKGLMLKLLKSMVGYEETFPNRIEKILTLQQEGNVE